MRRARRMLAAVMATATTTLAVIAAPAAATAAQDETDRPRLQNRLDDIVAVGAVGALARIQDARGGWRGTSGAAELDTTRPVPVNGRFRIGSITKTFISTVTLQLVNEGRLSLDDPVETWLPGVTPNGEHITVRHLLNHTSGLFDYKDTLPMPPSAAFMMNRWRTWTPAELVRRAVAKSPTFEPPGSAYEYSNTGYLLIGRIIEKVTGHSYGEEIERRIIRPLRLHETSVPGTSPRIRGPHPHGYLPREEGDPPPLTDYTAMNPSMFGASGEMISTTKDLNRFIAALLGGRLLSDRLLDEMMTPGVEDGTYGLGLAWHDTSCGVRVYGNDGDALAYQAWSYATEDARRRVTVALTPDFRADTDDAVDTFLEEAFCG